MTSTAIRTEGLTRSFGSMLAVDGLTLTVPAWSRGMKQKLAVARALLARPELVFLDEPTDGLDPVAASALRADIAGLAAGEGATVFLTTHNLAEAEQICAQVGIISGGKLLAW